MKSIEENNLEHIESVKKQVMDKVLAPIQQVYIDLGVLKDLRLGWLLSQATPEQRAYIVDNIEHYNKTYVYKDKLTYCFPELSDYEEQWQEGYKQYTDDAVNYAPDTTVFINLYDILKQMNRHNVTVNYSQPLRLTVNTYPYKLTPLIRQFADVISAAFSDVAKFRFISRPPLEISSPEWGAYQVIFTDHIVALVGVTSPWKELADDENWKALTTVYAVPYITEDAIRDSLKDEDEKLRSQLIASYEWQQTSLAFTETVMQVCSDFHFLDVPVAVENKSHGE